MHTFKRWAWLAGITASAALALTACGGSDAPLPPKVSINKVYVMGDSLADVGTFGVKFTVQNSLDPKSVQIWPQLVANAFGLDGSAQCNFYAFNGGTFAANTTAGCTNYAIGDSRIVGTVRFVGATDPRIVKTQLQQRASSGSYSDTDLLLIDGGGNDAADLATAYGGTATGAAGVAAYITFLKQLLSDEVINTLVTSLPNAQTLGLAAGAYSKPWPTPSMPKSPNWR